MRFDFDEDFQRALLRLCQFDEHFNHRAQVYLTPEYFTTEALGWVFKVMQFHYKKYSGQLCKEMELRHYVRQSGNEVVSREAEAVMALGHNIDGSFIKDQLREFVQRNIFTKAFHEGQKVYNQKGSVDEAADLMRAAMERVAEIDFEAPKRSIFFDELEARQMRRYRFSLDPNAETYTTGVVPLDKIVNGGIHAGEVFLIMAYPKVGKTTWLINQGFFAAFLSRVPVLHVNLEGPLDEIEDKYEACFSDLVYHDVRRGEIGDKAFREMIEEYDSLRGLLVIRSFDELDVNVMHIDGELSDLKTGRGFEPKVMIVDYADLGRSRNRGAHTETDHQTDFIRDLKRLSTNRRIATWTGSQAKRPSSRGKATKEHILVSSDIADSFGKIRIVDGYGSINATPEEQKRDEWRLHWEAYRGGRASKTWRLKNNAAHMRVALHVEELALKGDRSNGRKDDFDDVADSDGL